MRDAASAGVGAPSGGGACYKGRRRLLHVEAAVATQGAGVRYNRRRRLLHRAPALATTGSGGCYTGCRLPLQQAEAAATQGAGVRYNRRWRLLQRAATAATRLLPAALAVATNAFGGCYIGCRRAARTPARPAAKLQVYDAGAGVLHARDLGAACGGAADGAAGAGNGSTGVGGGTASRTRRRRRAAFVRAHPARAPLLLQKTVGAATKVRRRCYRRLMLLLQKATGAATRGRHRCHQRRRSCYKPSTAGDATRGCRRCYKRSRSYKRPPSLLQTEQELLQGVLRRRRYK